MSLVRRIIAWFDPGGHPDSLRRSTLHLNSVLALAISVLGVPVSLWFLGEGAALPFLINVFGLLACVASFVALRAGRTNLVAALQIACLLVAGTVFALAHPNFADFGLATILLTPIYAGYVAKLTIKRAALGATSLCLALVAGTHLLGVQSIAADRTGFVEQASVILFLIAGVIVAYTGWRLNEAFSRYEHSQIRAFQHLVEHVQDAVVRYASNGEMMFISRSAEALFGCRRYQLTGAGLIERVHVLDRPLLLSALDDARHHGFARVVEIRVRSDLEDAGSFFWIEASLSPISDPRAPAKPNEVIGILRDVTVRKDYEHEIRMAHQAAEAASQTKSRFLATIGHELRTPLNAIVGFTDMMLAQIGGKLSPEHDEYARLIAQSGKHLLDMVTMLLDMSKIEAGKFELHLDSFDPAGLAGPCVAMMGGQAEERGIVIEQKVGEDLPAMVGDERACRQMIINLMSNAIKFSPEGGTVRLTVGVKGTRIAISVADNGVGISKQDATRIGEPFFQANNGLDRKFEGAGLGLSIVRGLVDLHEGELVVESEVGVGTTITVLLPVAGPTDSGHLPWVEDLSQPDATAAPHSEPMSKTA